MAAPLPLWWFDDEVKVVKPGEKTLSGYGAGTESLVRCKIVNRRERVWADGVETSMSQSYMLLPARPEKSRSVTRVDEVPVPPRKVGARLPASAFPHPGPSLEVGFEVSRVDLVSVTTVFTVEDVDVGDTVVQGSRSWTVSHVEEEDDAVGREALIRVRLEARSG